MAETTQQTFDDLLTMIAEGTNDLSYKDAKRILAIMVPGIKIRTNPNQWRNGLYYVTFPEPPKAEDDGSRTSPISGRLRAGPP